MTRNSRTKFCVSESSESQEDGGSVQPQCGVINKGDLLTNLPQEITDEIFVKLPIRSVMRCKCVRRSWRDLIKGVEFARSYNPKPCLVFPDKGSDRYKMCDETWQPLFRFGLPPPLNQYSADPLKRLVIGSVSGLLLMRDVYYEYNREILFMCNPVTREYIELPPVPTRRCVYGFGVNILFGSILFGCVYGFGVSKLSRQYKILCCDESKSCHVYTLGGGRGEGLWRSIATPSPGSPRLKHVDYASFFNGNLHWLAYDFEENPLVCGFDLETELFTSFSLPPGRYSSLQFDKFHLCILDGRLCLHNDVDQYRVVIWSMNNYGDEKSWIKQYSFRLPDENGFLFPLDVLANGDFLFVFNYRLFIFYENTRATLTYGFLQRNTDSNIVIFTPSLISLKAMGIDNVQSLKLY